MGHPRPAFVLGVKEPSRNHMLRSSHRLFGEEERATCMVPMVAAFSGRPTISSHRGWLDARNIIARLVKAFTVHVQKLSLEESHGVEWVHKRFKEKMEGCPNRKTFSVSCSVFFLYF